MLIAAHEAGQLQFFGAHAALADTKAFAAFLAPFRQSEWVSIRRSHSANPKPFSRTSGAIRIASPSPGVSQTMRMQASNCWSRSNSCCRSGRLRAFAISCAAGKR